MIMPIIMSYHNSTVDFFDDFTHTGVTSQIEIDNLKDRSPSKYYQFNQANSTTSTLIAEDLSGAPIGRDVNLVTLLNTNLHRDEITRVRVLDAFGGVEYDSDTDGFTVVERVKLKGHDVEGRDIFVILGTPINGHQVEVSITNQPEVLGRSFLYIGTLYIDDTIDIKSQLNLFDSGGVDTSTKVISDGGGVTASSKPVLDQLTVELISNELNTWGDPSNPVGCLQHMRKTSGKHMPVIYLIYSEDVSSPYVTKSIYGTLDKVNRLKPVKALNIESGDTEAKHWSGDTEAKHWWRTTISITEEL